VEENEIFIILDCKDQSSDWMAFSFWYSLQKKIPSVEFAISAKKSLVEMFWWAKRIGVKVFYTSYDNITTNKKKLIFQPFVVAIREFNSNNIGPTCCKENLFSSFVSYEKGFGKFNTTDWIHKKDNPFYRASKRFYKDDLNYNEIYILNLWEKCENIYGKF
jgi:hypothetical protein